LLLCGSPFIVFQESSFARSLTERPGLSSMARNSWSSLCCPACSRASCSLSVIGSANTVQIVRPLVSISRSLVPGTSLNENG
jgi:hypothetical protein